MAVFTSTPISKPDGFKDSMDCTVRALATGLNIPYLAAWTSLKHCGGRKKNQGIIFKEYLAKNPEFFKEVSLPRTNTIYSNVDVEWIVKNFPIGRYIVTVHGHTFAMIDGIVMDYSAQEISTVYTLWRIK